MTKGATKILHASREIVPSSLKHLYRRSIRRLRSSPKSWPPEAKQLHLGCGGNLLPGWANVDLDAAAGAIRHDLTGPFPLPPETVKFIYSEHFIEHITRGQALALLRECHRVLAPGGVIRLSTPNLKKLLDEYLAGRTTEWSDVDWHPETTCQMLNEGMRLWGHQFVYDLDELTLLLKEAGFRHVNQAAWRESRHPELKGLECRPFHGEIIVEAIKLR
jgi:predicted SAM-dependent methyltransferase